MYCRFQKVSPASCECATRNVPHGLLTELSDPMSINIHEEKDVFLNGDQMCDRCLWQQRLPEVLHTRR